MSTQQGNNQSSLNNLSEHDPSAFGSGKGKEGSTPIGTYDTSTHHNAPGSEQIDSWSDGIPGTETNKNKNKK
ncbi:unnamed protein product [Rotaria sordida]|uniref:Uncharacterized protein n=1 Tax=Rotaria sordida TaxID=392033 RepID=A0A819N9D8_9BILA|nr:unnamed protein product [Rotaria sordida]CAF3994929.1 unnamed protein product [Rotaria sordida]